MDEDSLRKLKVTELKDLLLGKNLPTAGKKEELVSRLLENISSPKTSANGLANSTGNIMSQQERIAARTSRFSPVPTPTPSIQPHPQTQEALKKPPTQTPRQPQKQSQPTQGQLLSSDPMSVERLKARAERFGTVTSSKLKQLEEEEVKTSRLTRFN